MFIAIYSVNIRNDKKVTSLWPWKVVRKKQIRIFVRKSDEQTPNRKKLSSACSALWLYPRQRKIITHWNTFQRQPIVSAENLPLLDARQPLKFIGCCLLFKFDFEGRNRIIGTALSSAVSGSVRAFNLVVIDFIVGELN